MVLPVSADKSNSNSITFEEFDARYELAHPWPYVITVEGKVLTITTLNSWMWDETLTVYDLSSRKKVLTEKVAASQIMEVEVTLKKGIYLASLECIEKWRFVRKKVFESY